MSATLNDFIAREMEMLEAYDAKRPPGHPYAFHQHVRRVADDMYNLALEMSLPEARAQALKRATLVHDAGKRVLPANIWDVKGKPTEIVRRQRRNHTLLGVDLLNEYFGEDNNAPDVALVRDLMKHHHEAMDGTGWLGITGDKLSLEARMLCICDAFDGYSTWRPHFGDRDISPRGVLHRMGVEKASQFDTDIMKKFTKIKLAKEQ